MTKQRELAEHIDNAEVSAVSFAMSFDTRIAAIESIISAAVEPLLDELEPLQRFLNAYDKHAEGRPVRRGLDDEFYGIDGGDASGGASLRISQLRAIVAELAKWRPA